MADQQRRLTHMRHSLQKIIYADLIKHCDPEDAKMMAKKKEARIFESCKGNLGLYEAEFKRHYADHQASNPASVHRSSSGLTGGATLHRSSGLGGYGGSADDMSLTNVLQNNKYAPDDARDKLKHTQHIKKYVQQLKEGLRIAGEFPMEYPQLQSYRDKITKFIDSIMVDPSTKSLPDLHNDLKKIKSISETCMTPQILEKMKKHHQAIKRNRALLLQKQQQARGGSADPDYLRARASLKEKVKKLIPIREHIITKIERSSSFGAQLKSEYTEVRKRIERIVQFYEQGCKTMEDIHKCTRYLVATYQEWKRLTSGSSSSSSSSSSSGDSTLAKIKMETKTFVHQLQLLYDFYKKMLDFRQETKPDNADDETIFKDELDEIRNLRDIVSQILSKGKTDPSGAMLRLPDGVKTRINHLAYSAKLRKQFVLYQQLRTLEGCAEKCSNATGNEWYLQLKAPVEKLIGDIGQLKRTQPPSKDTNKVFAEFLRFRDHMRQLKAGHQHGQGPQLAPAGMGMSRQGRTNKMTAAEKKAAQKRAAAAQRRSATEQQQQQQQQLAAAQMGRASVIANTNAAADKRAMAAARKKADAAKKAADAAAIAQRNANAVAALQNPQAGTAPALKMNYEMDLGLGNLLPAVSPMPGMSPNPTAAAAAAAAAQKRKAEASFNAAASAAAAAATTTVAAGAAGAGAGVDLPAGHGGHPKRARGDAESPGDKAALTNVLETLHMRREAAAAAAKAQQSAVVPSVPTATATAIAAPLPAAATAVAAGTALPTPTSTAAAATTTATATATATAMPGQLGHTIDAATGLGTAPTTTSTVPLPAAAASTVPGVAAAALPNTVVPPAGATMVSPAI